MTVRTISVYFRERFPVGGVVLISLGLALFTGSLSQTVRGWSGAGQTALIAVVFAAFLLRQRVTDEFKDQRHDAKHFPGRPFQRGIISAKELIALGIAAAVVEIAAVLGLGGWESLGWYLPVLGYSFLMAKEFFAPAWLERHFTLYFAVHEVILLLLAGWLAKVTGAAGDGRTLAWIIAFTAIMMSIEVGRKLEFRRDPQGRIVHDTYSAVWGRDQTLHTLQILVVITGLALAYTRSALSLAIVSAVAALVLGIPLRDMGVKVTIIAHFGLLIALGLLR